ncbi:MAG: hypothetical protein FWH49_05710 [Clostridiales bacterium]|nr:hypothetical protein [Clostridiales bacterium]
MNKRDLLFTMANFLEALIHNDPKRVKVAANCKATYEGAQAPLGSGDIWGRPRRIPYRQSLWMSRTRRYASAASSPTMSSVNYGK